ncbi:MAG: peptidase M15 [Nitrosomonadaceae bacterium]|nr:peptidase M15 [Nitrosomonadaceae bacterium]
MLRKIIYFLIMVNYMVSTNAISKDMPDNFVDLKKHIPSINLDLRYFTKNNFVGTRIDGYINPKALLSVEAANALKRIQSELAIFGLSLKIYDAYRPQQAVNHFIRWAKDSTDIKMKSYYYPEIEKKELFKEGYLANKSSHSRGSTVDVSIISLHGAKPEELDMGTNWDFFSNTSNPNSLSVTAQQRANRMLLSHMMQKYGFKPHKKEWWHFTLEDEPYPDEYFNIPIK